MLAVDMESDSPAFDEENRIVDSEEVVKMCGCLVRLDRDALDRNYMGHAAQVQTLAAAHSSVIDFLKTQSIKIGSENVVKFSKSKANLRMAETCLIYLRYFPANSITLTQGNITSYPFARLCALMWDNFYREVLSTTEPVDMARLNDLVMELLSSPTATLNWVKLSNPENISEGVNFGVNVYQLKPAIYYAALLGLPDIVRKLIQEGTPVDSVVGPRFGTQPDLYTAEWSSPLQVATGKGNVEIAKILLDAGSHVDLKHDKGFTALYLACRNRDKKMVELLLAHGANPNIQHCGTWDHALQLACANGDEEIVGLLLENGAKIDLHGDFFDNAFQVACVEGGKLETAKILIEAGANFRMTNTIGHSALLATILNRRSQLELFDYLIDLDVDPLQGDRRGCNGLHYAARAKKCEVIKRLLEFGLDVNGTDSNGWSPLHWAVASTEDSADVVRLLLQSGCDKSMRDKQDKTARDLAMLFNRTEEATMLDGTAQAYAKASPGGACAVQFLIYICDGCSVVSKAQSVPLIKLIGYKDRRHCKPASWYRCADCINFDFCFRCILDKDVTHLKDHRFSNEPA